MDKQDIKTLAESAVFKGIPGNQIEEILEITGYNIKTYKPDEAVFVDGMEFVKTGFVLTGEAHVVTQGSHGDTSIMATILPGDTFTEVVNFLGVKQPPVSVVVVKPSRIALIDLRKLTNPTPENAALFAPVTANIINLLADKCMHLRSKVELLSRRTIRGKVAHYLETLMEKQGSTNITLHFNREELADFLCVNRSALSRELAALKAEGIIDYSRDKVEILKPEELSFMR